jgi:hypothetical protein
MPSPEASRENLKKARVHWREPRRWRSRREAQIIRQLVWQEWWQAQKYYGGRGPSSRRLARTLGCSHRWVQSLVREIRADPNQLQRLALSRGRASFEMLQYAREETRRMRAEGRLLPETVRLKMSQARRQGSPPRTRGRAVALDGAKPINVRDAPSLADNQSEPVWFDRLGSTRPSGKAGGKYRWMV